MAAVVERKGTPLLGYKEGQSWAGGLRNSGGQRGRLGGQRGRLGGQRKIERGAGSHEGYKEVC